LKGLPVVAAGAALAAGLSVARSAHAAGSDLLKIALIGCGGRGTGAANDCLGSNQNVKLVAVADVFADRANGAVNHLRRAVPDKVDVSNDRVFIGFDAYQKAIDCGVDVVLLCTPPGFRPIHYAAAVKAGKNAFMEKPCCVDAPGFKILMEANRVADEKGLKVAVGLQRRHSQEYLPKIKRIHDGEIGDVKLLRAYWNGGFLSGGFGNRASGAKSEMEFQIRNWNFFRWLSGDHIVEQHVHNIDVCNWVKNDHPVEANGMGSRQVRHAAQIFDHHIVEFTYKDGAKFYSQCRQFGGCWDSVTESVVGVKGSMNLGGNGSDGYRQEHVDLINAIRNGTKLNDGWHGATSSMTGVLGRMASYSGQTVKWDDAVTNGPSELPGTFALDANPPALPDKDGNYEVPTAGIYKAY
jgi:predicted dehydrogenase